MLFATQSWLAETPAQKAAASSPAYFQVLMAVLSLAVGMFVIGKKPLRLPKIRRFSRIDAFCRVHAAVHAPGPGHVKSCRDKQRTGRPIPVSACAVIAGFPIVQVDVVVSWMNCPFERHLHLLEVCTNNSLLLAIVHYRETAASARTYLR